MKGRREPLIVIVACVLLAICLLGGYGFGYFNGHRQGLEEAKEDLFLHAGHEIETSAVINYIDVIRFRLSAVTGWTLIAIAAGLLYRRFRDAPALYSLMGAALVLFAELMVMSAETADFWDGAFRWSSLLGRSAKIIQQGEFLGIFLFGYGLLRFATSAVPSRKSR